MHSSPTHTAVVCTAHWPQKGGGAHALDSTYKPRASDSDTAACTVNKKNMESETVSKGRTLLSDVIRSLIDSLPFPAAGHGLDIGERTYFLQTPFSQGKINFYNPPVHVVLGNFLWISWLHNLCLYFQQGSWSQECVLNVSSEQYLG